MPATVNEQMVDSVTQDNVKTVAGSGSWAVAQRQLDYVSHAKRVDALSEVALQRFIAGDVTNKDALALSKAFKGEAESSILSDLSGLDAGQLGQKVANTAPPETGNNIQALAAQLSSAVAMLQAAVATIGQPPVKP